MNRRIPRTVPRPRDHSQLVIVLLVSFLLSLTYALRVPLWTAPDENAHFEYIEHLVAHRAFPVFVSREQGNYEGHQPPLYYLIATPVFLIARALGRDSACYAVRMLSCFLGLITVITCWWTARLLLPRHTSLALLATAFVGLLPMHLFLSSSVGNDVMVGVWCSLTLALLARQVLESRFAPVTSLGTGLVLGLALLTKTGCLTLLPVAWLGGAWQIRQGKRGWRRCGVHALMVTVGVLLVSGWWWARNCAVYGEPFAMRRFMEGFASSPHPDFFFERGFGVLQYFLLVAQLTFMSFWGILGETNASIRALARLEGGASTGEWALYLVPMAVAALLSLAGIVGWILAVPALTRRAEGRFHRSRKTFPLLTCRGEAPLDSVSPACARVLFAYATAVVLVLLSFLQFNTQFFQAQARYFYPALLPIVLLVSLGWAHLPGRIMRTAIACGVLLLCFLSLCNLTIWRA